MNGAQFSAMAIIVSETYLIKIIPKISIVLFYTTLDPRLNFKSEFTVSYITNLSLLLSIIITIIVQKNSRMTNIYIGLMCSWFL